MSVGPLVRRDGLPQPDQSANRILEQCYSRNADTTKGIGNDRSSEGNGTLNGILNIIDATYGVQCDGIP